MTPEERRAVVERCLVAFERSVDESAAKKRNWLGTESECLEKLEERKILGNKPVEHFSETLLRQLNGEAPIGSGKLGCAPVRNMQEGPE